MRSVKIDYFTERESALGAAWTAGRHQLSRRRSRSCRHGKGEAERADYSLVVSSSEALRDRPARKPDGAGEHDQAGRQCDNYRGRRAAALIFCVGLGTGGAGSRLGLLVLARLLCSTRREAVRGSPLVVEAVLVEAVSCLQGVVDSLPALDLGEEFCELLRPVGVVQILHDAPGLAVEEVYGGRVSRGGGDLAHREHVAATDGLVDGVPEATRVVLAVNGGSSVRPGRQMAGSALASGMSQDVGNLGAER